jgi:dimethylaniline monooxygenase (N-oxide forming)
MLPPRYRLSGPGATPEARDRFAEQLAASPRAPVDPADVEALHKFGWDATVWHVVRAGSGSPW